MDNMSLHKVVLIKSFVEVGVGKFLQVVNVLLRDLSSDFSETWVIHINFFVGVGKSLQVVKVLRRDLSFDFSETRFVHMIKSVVEVGVGKSLHLRAARSFDFIVPTPKP
ncbi:PREDICTED: PRUPE_1G026200 [Prunus dulcis]|uniref:PREDICTED: PRUPE_1G026200 n=1 Tax=Prunus dulcis TaxID=3755 RepID=A0A5E4G0E1_PRUDU|nr:PREDICTED: PRUPE_1G026200 [Prunus dulcis]